MVDETGVYEERYRLTPTMGILLLGCLVFIIPAILLSAPLILKVAVVGVFGWFALYSVAAVISRKVAFRVDERGVTFGGGPFRYSSSCRLFAWEDIEAIALWQRYTPFRIGPWTLFRMGPVRYIGVRRRAGAKSITPGRRRPADRPARNITAWTLDRDRLAEAVAAYAPSVHIEAGAAAHD